MFSPHCEDASLFCIKVEHGLTNYLNVSIVIMPITILIVISVCVVFLDHHILKMEISYIDQAMACLFATFSVAGGEKGRITKEAFMALLDKDLHGYEMVRRTSLIC